GIVSWVPGSGSTPDTITIQIPAFTAGFRAGQKSLTIRNSGGQSSVNGITLHVTGTGYSPNIVNVGPWTPGNPHVLQNAIDAGSTTPGSLLVLSPGTYNENIVM